MAQTLKLLVVLTKNVEEPWNPQKLKPLVFQLRIWYSSKVTSHSSATYTLATRMLDTLNSIALEWLSRDKTLEGLLTRRYLRSHKAWITKDVYSRVIIRTVRYTLNRIILRHAQKQWHILQWSRCTGLCASISLILQFVSD